jgi:hypothetical protein
VVPGAFVGAKLLSWVSRARVGSGGKWWEVVEKYISGQKNYEKNDTIPLVVIDEEKEKTLKIGYMTLYAKLFMGSQKCDGEKKPKSLYIPYDK